MAIRKNHMRDNQMYALYQNGLSIGELSLKYEITSQRVRNILHDIKRELSLPAFQQHLNIRTVNALKAAGYVLTDDTDKLDEQAIRDALASGQLRVGQFIDARKFTQAQYDDLTRALKLPAKAEEPTSINPRTAPKPKRDKTGSKRAIRPSTSRDHQALCLPITSGKLGHFSVREDVKVCRPPVRGVPRSP